MSYKIIIVHSIMHTGTWFTCNMLSNSNLRSLSRSDVWLKDKYGKVIEDLNLDNKCSNAYWKNKISNLSQEGWNINDLDLLILQSHHQTINSNLINILKKRKTEVPVVIPIRDPLLTLNSKLWRGKEFHHNDSCTSSQSREQRCKRYINLFKEILSLPKENVYLFPIDLKDDENSRISRVSNMAEFCNIEFSDKMKELASNWGFVNSTKQLVNTEQSPYEIFKNKYRNNNISYVKRKMNIEFNLLQRDNKLKSLLSDIGYNDLIWM